MHTGSKVTQQHVEALLGAVSPRYLLSEDPVEAVFLCTSRKLTHVATTKRRLIGFLDRETSRNRGIEFEIPGACIKQFSVEGKRLKLDRGLRGGLTSIGVVHPEDAEDLQRCIEAIRPEPSSYIPAVSSAPTDSLRPPLFVQLRDRVKAAIEENISANEPIMAVVRGTNGQAIVGTDRRAIVCKPGWMAGATLGCEVTTYNYLNITGIQIHKGMVTGTVAVETGQQMQRTSYWKQGDGDSYKAPNAIPVGGGWDEVKEQVALLRHAIDRARAPTISPVTPAPAAAATISVADELSKLVALRDAGVLTDDEFQSAKMRILSG